jgi:hypothetical protein
VNDWEDYDQIFDKLLWLCKRKFETTRWRGRFGGIPPRGLLLEDIIQNAVVKTLSGGRTWNKEKYDLLEHLYRVVCSDLYHHATCRENRSTDYRDVGDLPNIADLSSAEDILMRKQTEQAGEIALKLFLDHCKINDPKLVDLFHVMNGLNIKSEADQALLLKLSLREMQSLKRKFRRSMASFLLNMPKGQNGYGGGS